MLQCLYRRGHCLFLSNKFSIFCLLKRIIRYSNLKQKVIDLFIDFEFWQLCKHVVWFCDFMRQKAGVADEYVQVLFSYSFFVITWSGENTFNATPSVWSLYILGHFWVQADKLPMSLSYSGKFPSGHAKIQWNEMYRMASVLFNA